MDELGCVPENQQPAGSWGGGVNKVTLHLRHSRIHIQVMRTLITHRTHRLLGGTQKGKGKGKASHPGKGNKYQKGRLTKGARNLLFCSGLRRSRN